MEAWASRIWRAICERKNQDDVGRGEEKGGIRGEGRGGE